MASSEPVSAYCIAADLLDLKPVELQTPLTPEDFTDLLGEFQRGMGRAVFPTSRD